MQYSYTLGKADQLCNLGIPFRILLHAVHRIHLLLICFYTAGQLPELHDSELYRM